MGTTPFRVTTDAPDPIMLFNLSKIYIISPKALKDMGAADFAKKPVGTGPYKVVEWVKDDRITLEPNTSYWGGKPKFSKITFKPIPEASARAAALRTGAADIVTLLPIPEVGNVKSSPDLDVLTTPSLRLMYLILDAVNEGPVKDARVRQALNYAVDKDAIVNSVLQGYGVKLQGQILSKEYVGFNPDLQPYPYDADKARQLLAQAGFSSGFSVTLFSPQGRYQNDKEVSEGVAGQLAKVGVQANIKVEEWAAYIKYLIAKTLTPVAFIGMSTFPDADPMLSIHIAGNPYSYYANPQFEEVLKKARSTTDEGQRTALYKQATQTLHDDPPGIFLYQQVDIYGANKRVQNWKPRPDERLLIQQGDLSIDVR
ncbi:MAG: ABC transporter substrate-binding protein [Chloroflexi bacterium]|nr:ABC transporter substrate-binding protein [Chloroflexota bacterium]